jgi:hypothetical protein
MVYRLLLINHARIRFAARFCQRFSVLSFTPPAVREHGRWLDCVKKWVKKKKPRQSAVYVSHYVSITRLWGGVLILFLMLKLLFFITRWNCFRAKTPPASLLCANVSTSPNLENFFFCFKHYSTFELEENSSSASSPFGLSVFLHGNRLAPIFPPIVFPPFSLSCLADWVVRIIRILSFLFPFLHARHYPSSQNIMIAMHNREIDFQVRLVPVGFSQV